LLKSILQYTHPFLVLPLGGMQQYGDVNYERDASGLNYWKERVTVLHGSMIERWGVFGMQCGVAERQLGAQHLLEQYHQLLTRMEAQERDGVPGLWL